MYKILSPMSLDFEFRGLGVWLPHAIALQAPPEMPPLHTEQEVFHAKLLSKQEASRLQPKTWLQHFTDASLPTTLCCMLSPKEASLSHEYCSLSQNGNQAPVDKRPSPHTAKSAPSCWTTINCHNHAIYINFYTFKQHTGGGLVALLSPSIPSNPIVSLINSVSQVPLSKPGPSDPLSTPGCISQADAASLLPQIIILMCTYP